MHAVYLAWRHGGHDPFRWWHRLDEHGYPLDANELERWMDAPERPADARRIRNLLYAFSLKAAAEQIELAGMSLAGG